MYDIAQVRVKDNFTCRILDVRAAVVKSVTEKDKILSELL